MTVLPEIRSVRAPEESPASMTEPQPQAGRRRQWAFALVWAAGLYWLALFAATHWPSTLPGLDHGYLDKVAHLAAFCGLAMIVATAWAAFVGRLAISALVALVILLAIYGAIDEILQPPMGRNCSIYDWYADVTGAFVGATFFAVVINRFFRVGGAELTVSQTS